MERSSPDKSTSAGQADKATSALPAAAEVHAEAVTKIDPPNEAQHQHTANISCHQDNDEPPASVSTPQREQLPPPQHLPGNGEGIGMGPAALWAGSGAIPALPTTMSPRGVPAPLHHPIGAAGGGGGDDGHAAAIHADPSACRDPSATGLSGVCAGQQEALDLKIQ